MTPRRWVAVMLGGGKGGPNEYSIRAEGTEDGAHAIARVHARQGQDAGTNARLIAAAPELRDALTAMLRRDTISCSCDEDEMRCHWHYATRLAEAALARAGGVRL